MLGIMDFDKALNLASSRGFDLILISEANTPVVKLGDFSKLQ
jgi:translation initiation factor IF-3